MPELPSIRPFQAVVLGVFALLGVVGLFVFTRYTGSNNGSTAVGTVTIWEPSRKKEVDQTLSDLRQAHQEYKSVSYVEKAPGTFDADLANALASGAGPDLVVISQEELQANKSKLEVIPFTSIPQRTYLDTYLSEYQLFLTDAGTYGVPLVLDPLVLYYNRPMLASVGAAKAPTTWEAVAGLVPAITKVTGGQTITKATIPFGSYGNVSNARAIVSLLFLQAGSLITQTGTQGLHSTFGDDTLSNGASAAGPAVSAMNFYTQFADPGKTTYSWNPALLSSRQEFLSGDLALYPGFASEYSALKAANPNLDFDIAAIPQPGTATKRATFGLAYVFAIPKVAANKSGAYSTAIALSASDMLPGLAQNLGMAPAVSSLLTADPSDVYRTVFYPEAITAAGWLSPAPATTDTIFAGIIQNIVSGRMQTQNALTAAARLIDANL